MNKIKISDSDKRLLIIFFAIVILACSYFFIFNKGMTKASELEAQNEQDSAKVQQMQQMEELAKTLADANDRRTLLRSIRPI